MRGFSPASSKYALVLTNGVPVGSGNISTIGLSDVERIEVLKGPFSSIYGTSAMGGVINIISRRSTGALRGNISAGVGSYGQGNHAINLGGRIYKGLSFDFNGSYDAMTRSYEVGRHNMLSLSSIEKRIVDESTRGKVMSGNTYGVFTGSLRVGLDFSPRWSLNVYENLFLGSGIQSPGSIYRVYGQSKKDLNRSATSIQLLGRLGAHQMTYTGYYSTEWQKYYNDHTDDAYVNYKGDNQTFGLMLQDQWRIGRHNLVFGLDLKNLNYTTKRFDATGQSITEYSPNYHTFNTGVFAQGNLAFLSDDRLIVSAGLRADFMNFSVEANEALKSTKITEHHSVLSPNLGLKLTVAEGLRLHATVGGAFLAPDAYQKAGRYETAYGITRGNPDLKPERSVSVDAGLTYSDARRGWQLDATYFHSMHKDMIVRRGAGQEGNLYVTTYANADEARIQGIELMGAYDFGAKANYRYSLRASVNATFMLQSEVKANGSESWAPVQSVRKQNVSFALDYKNRHGWGIGVNGRFLGKRWESDFFRSYETSQNIRVGLPALATAEWPNTPGMLRHPEALVFGVSGEYDVTRRLRLNLNINNLFDEHYTEKDGYHMMGRNFMVRATYRF